MLLLPLLKRAPYARVITVASSAHLIGDINFTNINLVNGDYGRLKAYAQSKLANVRFSRELARRLGSDSTVHTYSLHPGPVHTEIQRHASYQATGIGGVGGYFWYTPPGRNFFENTPPPWRIWVKPPFCFLNERKTLKFTLI